MEQERFNFECLEFEPDQYHDQYSWNRLVSILASSSTLRHLRIIRSVTPEHRFRTSWEIHRLLEAILGGGKTETLINNNKSLRSRRIVQCPLATLRSLQLDHFTKDDIVHLPMLLKVHPTLHEFGLSLFPAEQCQIPIELALVLAKMTKLKTLILHVPEGHVLKVSPSTRTSFVRLHTLEVSLPHSPQVVSLMTQLLPSNPSCACRVLRELRLTTDAVVATVVNAIADFMRQTQTLTELHLDFRYHYLDNDGCIVLARALQDNASLAEIGLGRWLSREAAVAKGRSIHDVICHEGGCAALIRMLKVNMSLHILIFEGLTWPGEKEEENDDDDEVKNSRVISEMEHKLIDDYEEIHHLGGANNENAKEFTVPVSGNAEELVDWQENNGEQVRFDFDVAAGNNAGTKKVWTQTTAPWLVDSAIFYLGLNLCGRGSLLRNQSATLDDWIRVLANNNMHLGRLYYFLRCQPSLIAKGAAS